MELSLQEKNELLKAFTELLKDANGKGPRNINIKYFQDEIHILMDGVISNFEKYLIRNFGEEAIGFLRNFYERDCYNAEQNFLSRIRPIMRYDLKFYELESDFRNDHFIYKMKICSLDA